MTGPEKTEGTAGSRWFGQGRLESHVDGVRLPYREGGDRSDAGQGAGLLQQAHRRVGESLEGHGMLPGFEDLAPRLGHEEVVHEMLEVEPGQAGHEAVFGRVDASQTPDAVVPGAVTGVFADANLVVAHHDAELCRAESFMCHV